MIDITKIETMIWMRADENKIWIDLVLSDSQKGFL